MAVNGDQMREYVASLQQGVIDLFDAQTIDQVAAAMDVKASALCDIGGALGRDPERATDLGGRIREDRDKLATSYQAMVASPTEEWAVGNVLVGRQGDARGRPPVPGQPGPYRRRLRRCPDMERPLLGAGVTRPDQAATCGPPSTRESTREEGRDGGPTAHEGPAVRRDRPGVP